MTTPTLNRRAFPGSLAGTALAATLPAADSPRKKIALLGSVSRTHSHAQHFIDRFLLGYGWKGAWRPPSVDLAALYIDQFPDGDLARGRRQQLAVGQHRHPVADSV